jgi:hypothetical protein
MVSTGVLDHDVALTASVPTGASMRKTASPTRTTNTRSIAPEFLESPIPPRPEARKSACR